MTGKSRSNPLVARSLRFSARPRALIGLAVAALLVLASAQGLAPDPDSMTGLRVTPLYAGFCRAELVGLLVVVTIGAAAAIASERQEKTWDTLALSTLSDTELVLGKAAGVIPSVLLLALLLVPVHLAYGMAWGTPWGIVLGVQFLFLGAGVGAAGLGLICSAACGRVLHAVALAAAAIVFGWFAALDGLSSAWSSTRLARVGHPFRLLDDLVTSSVSVEVAAWRALAFLFAAGLGGALAVLAAIRLARRPLEGPVLAVPGQFRARHGKTERIWDDPIYWRECRSRGARRTLRIGGLLILGLAVALTVRKRNPALGGAWAQFAGLSASYAAMLIEFGGLLLGLRASVAIADERRRGMLAPLYLAGIGPAGLVWSKLKGALRPAVPLTAMVAIFWLSDVGTLIGSFTNLRLWLDGLVLLTAAGASYFLAVSLGLLASAWARSLRVALLGGVALLVAWDAAPRVIPRVVHWAWPGISIHHQIRLAYLIGGQVGRLLTILRSHVGRIPHHYPPSWAVSWIPVTALTGIAALIAAVFRMSREDGGRRGVRPESRSDRRQSTVSRSTRPGLGHSITPAADDGPSSARGET